MQHQFWRARNLALIIGIGLGASMMVAPTAYADEPFNEAGWSIVEEPQGGGSPIEADPEGEEDPGASLGADRPGDQDDLASDEPDPFPDEADPTEAEPDEGEPVEIGSEIIGAGEVSGQCIQTMSDEPLEMCVKPSAPKVEAADGVVRSAGAPVLPDACLKLIDAAWKRISRTKMCQLSGATITLTRTRGTVTTVTGVALFNVINYAYTDASLGTWGHQVELAAHSAWGDAVNVSVSGSASCRGGCKLDSSSFPPQTATLGKWLTGGSRHNTTVTTKGQKGTAATTWKLAFKARGAYPAASLKYTSLKTRCDKAVPGLSTIGCVVPGYTPAIAYHESELPDVVRHIRDAQESGLPGAYPRGTPLTRLTGPKIKKNRQRACPRSLTRPAGKSCDEYPFASTNQGALTGGGAARTFGWCSVPGASHTGATGYSRCMINKAQNSKAGTALGKFLKAQRVISGDKYRVALRG